MAATLLATYFVVVGVPHTDTRVEPEAVIMDRFPLDDYASHPLNAGVAYFCLPDGVVKINTASDDAAALRPRLFSFALTDADGARSFASCAMFFERRACDPGTLVPKVLCILSKWPFFSVYNELFRFILASFVQRSDNAPPQELWCAGDTQTPPCAVLLEHVLCSFLPHVHVPPQGVEMTLRFGDRVAKLRRHMPPLPTVDPAVFAELFACLDAENVVFLLSCILMEQRILVHTTHYERLTPVCEALQALLFPFYWQHVYVPLLPLQFLEYLQAPVPFIMGVHSDFLATQTAVECVASAVMVHLDFNKVVTPMDIVLPGDVAYDMVPEFPTAIRHRLVAHIRMHAPAPRADAANASNCPPRELSQHACLAVRAACLDALSSLLVGYRNYVTRVRLKHATKLNQPVDSQPHLQDKASFAHDFEVNFNSGRFLKKADPSCRKFLRPLLATQAFMSFIDDAARVGEVFPSHVTDPAALGAMFHQMVGEFHRQDDAQDAAEIQLFDLCTRLNEHATNGTISRPAFVGGHQSPGRGRGRYTASEILELLESTGGHPGSKPSPTMDVDAVLRAASHRAALDRPEHLLAEQMWHTGMARVLPAPAADDDASQVPAVGTLPQLDDATLEHFGLYNQPDDDDDVDGDAMSPVAPPASEPTHGSGDADTQSAPASPPAIGRARALSRTALAREFSVGDDPLLASDNVTIGEEAPRGLAGDTASAAVPRVRAESATSSIGATSNSSGGGSLRALGGTQSGRSRRAGRRSSMLLTGMDINRGSTRRGSVMTRQQYMKMHVPATSSSGADDSLGGIVEESNGSDDSDSDTEAAHTGAGAGAGAGASVDTAPPQQASFVDEDGELWLRDIATGRLVRASDLMAPVAPPPPPPRRVFSGRTRSADGGAVSSPDVARVRQQGAARVKRGSTGNVKGSTGSPLASAKRFFASKMKMFRRDGASPR